jgi:OOP family OmpA-OmpF porin
VRVLKLSSVLVVVTTAVLLSPVAAAEDSGWYLGGNIGQSRATIDDEKIVDGLHDQGFITTSITNDDRHFGYKLFGGYQFNRFLSLEGGYFDLGQFGFAANTLPEGSYRGNIRLNGANLDLLGTLPLTQRLGLFARIGVNYADARDTFSGTGFVAVSAPRSSEDAANYKFGLGLQYAFTESLVMRLEAERYRVDDPVEHGADMDLYSIGLVYRFGRHAPAPLVRESPVAPPAPPPAPPPEVAAAPAPLPVVVAVAAPTQQYCSLLDLEFEINHDQVQREAKEKLRVVGRFLNKYGETTAVIEGHTDNVGRADSNMALSEARAQNVVKYLEDNFQIAPGRLQAVGYGDSRPRADNSTEEGKRQNRRIDAVIPCVSDMAGLSVVAARFTMATVIEFEQSTSELPPRYREALIHVADFLKVNPSVTATVEGHSSNLAATPELALELSHRRAQIVVNYLVDELGVNPAQVSARGFGETRRFAYNTTAEGRRENRRVNIIFNYPQ